MSTRYDENIFKSNMIYVIGFQKNTFACFCEDFFVAVV